jgi:hypothetical protein
MSVQVYVAFSTLKILLCKVVTFVTNLQLLSLLVLLLIPILFLLSSAKKGSAVKPQGRVIIMDEVDGMGAGDRGGYVYTPYIDSLQYPIRYTLFLNYACIYTLHTLNTHPTYPYTAN